MIWNNGNITVKKYTFSKTGLTKVLFICDLFDANGLLFSYERFLHIKSFPVTSREFNYVIRAIPTGVIHLMKTNLHFQEGLRTEPILMINGIDIMKTKYNNKHIRNTFLEKRRIVPRGKAFWDNIFDGIVWQKAWLLPYMFCINNKIKEIHIQILHYISNQFILF